jgi:hypothetical protein
VVERVIKIAAIQMEVNPAPKEERLQRAEGLVSQASQAGAQLVVLPELFNTGYAYREENFHLAEEFNGLTVTWLKSSAARHQVHLAGSLLLRDRKDTFNALLLSTPVGGVWRYDKNYPWGWERAYFRKGRGTCVAHTILGDIGMLICWDIAHTSLWRRYAGQVDLMLVTSCPPDIANPTYQFPNGEQVTADDMGVLARRMRGAGRLVFEDILSQQSAWLGVPVVNTVACGRFHSPIPRGKASLLSLLPAAPRLALHLKQANGQVLAERGQEQGEGFALAEVILPDRRPRPEGPQLKSPLPWITYGYADLILPTLMLPVYQKGMQEL